ncbi:MAG: DNA-binding protein [Candidatus Thermoplasmatota archaeon]|nr:DNA-binding protein [Candidatus Thermoplasmatota archaeon]
MDAEDIKRRMMQQIQRESEEQAGEEYIRDQKRAIMRQLLDADARERLGRIRIANPLNAEMIENQLIRLYQMGRIREKLDDKTFQILIKNLMPKKRDIKIRRI